MKIILCSQKDSVRERWRSILQKYKYSLYQASYPQMLQTIVHKNEQYLFMIHQSFVNVQTVAKLCRNSEFYKVFMLSDNPNKEEGLALLQTGAVGYANTYITEARLAEAVKIVCSGRVWFGQEIISMLMHAMNVNRKQREGEAVKEAESILNVLSEREKEIAILVSDGMSNQNIAEKLYISERTVKSHLSTIFTKTGAQSRLQLALMILGYKS